MILLKLAAPPRRAPKSLCDACVCAHIVRGHGPGEEMVFCGFVFPLRDVLFPVRECSDFKPKREPKASDAARANAEDEVA